MNRLSYWRVKRGLDIALCIVAVPIAVPLLAICAVAIWVETPGRVLFRQTRVGRHGKSFRMYKFRTMVHNAEELKPSLMHLSVLPPPDFKILRDPRVTRVGGFLRRTSLDELPQLFNVLRGEMSLVGPRPTDFGLELYQLWHTERLEVLPGVTGLWQVYGRNKTDFDERLRLDIRYIDQMSLAQDLKILWRTVGVVTARTGA